MRNVRAVALAHLIARLLTQKSDGELLFGDQTNVANISSVVPLHGEPNTVFVVYGKETFLVKVEEM